MWVLYAALVAILVAGRRVTNQQFQFPAKELVLATKLGVTLLCVPFLFFIEWPTNPYFYLFAAAAAPLAYYKDRKAYGLTASAGAGPVTRIEPLSVPLVFIIWLAIDRPLLQTQLEQPLLFVAIIVSILAAVFFASRLRHCALNRKTLLDMLPMIAASAGLNLLAKGCTETMTNDGGIIIYIFVMSALASVIAFQTNGRTKIMKKAQFRNKKFLIVASLLCLSLMAVISLRLLAFQGAANPAYASSIMLMGPFWVLLFNRMLKHKEKGNITNGIGIVCAAIALAFLTSL